MHDGEMTIFVNSYLGHLGKTVIGRVYVEDKDDWDLPDKTFSWAPGKSLSGFNLASNGEVSTLRSSNLAHRGFIYSTSCVLLHSKFDAIAIVVLLLPIKGHEIFIDNR